MRLEHELSAALGARYRNSWLGLPSLEARIESNAAYCSPWRSIEPTAIEEVLQGSAGQSVDNHQETSRRKVDEEQWFAWTSLAQRQEPCRRQGPSGSTSKSTAARSMNTRRSAQLEGLVAMILDWAMNGFRESRLRTT